MRNYDLYNTREFGEWVFRGGLTGEEIYLFEKFLLPLGGGLGLLDVGTGNGRLLFELAERYCPDCRLCGIDMSEKLISAAKDVCRGKSSLMEFHQMDAADLAFGDDVFDVVLALQQIVSLIEAAESRESVMRECYRVLKKDGLLLSSFLHYEGRWFNVLASVLSLPGKVIKGDFKYLNFRYLPWLKLAGKVNIRYFIEKQPYTYWYKVDEILGMMEKVGFKIVEVKTSLMIRRNIEQFSNGGMLYIAAKKV
jgi:ubiquinone/menaquinone biosynthesis C-methylase UbiE